MNFKKIVACCLAASVAVMPASGTVFAAELNTEQKAEELTGEQMSPDGTGADNGQTTDQAAKEDEKSKVNNPDSQSTESTAKDAPAVGEETVTEKATTDENEANEIQSEDEAGVMGNSVEEEGTGMLLFRTAASGYTTTNWGVTRYHRNSDVDGKTMIKVIDISKHNGTVDFNKVKAAGVDGVILRIAYQGYSWSGSLNKDPLFETNYTKARNAGLKVGVYIYTEALNTSEGTQQANYVLNLLDGRKLDLPVVFDYENYGSVGTKDRIVKYGLSRTTGTNTALAFLDKIKAAGYTGMIYFAPGFEANHLYGNTIADKGYLIWLARYNTYAVTESKYPSWYKGRIDMWQFASTGVSVNGVSGNVDANYWYDGTDVTLSSYSGNVNVGSTVKISPSSKSHWFGKGYSESYTFSSNNTGVATVDGSGNVKGVKAGTAKITVKGKSSGSTATYTVTVKAVSAPTQTPDLSTSETPSTQTPSKPATANFTSLAAPGNVRLSSASASTITIAWNGVSNSPTYIVCRSEAPNGSFKQIGTTTGTSYTDKSVSSNKEYYYKVYSSKKNSLGKTIESAWSNMATCSAKSSQGSTVNQMKTKVNLNMRSNPGTNYSVVTTIPSGKVVNVIANTKDSKGNAWLKVTYNGKTGYVYSSTSYLQKYTAPTYTTKTTKVRLNMRTGAGTGYRVIMTIPVGKKVTVLSKSGSWLKVSYSGKTGYVYNSSAYLK